MTMNFVNSNTSNQNHNDENTINNYVDQTDEMPSSSQHGNL